MEARLLRAIMLRNACTYMIPKEKHYILARFALPKGHQWGGHACEDSKQPKVQGECIGPVSGSVSMSTKDIIKMVGSSLTLPLPIINDCNVR